MRWKWLLIVVGGLIVLLVVALYIVLATYDFNYLKPYITRAAREATGRELILGGDIRLKISLTPALVVEKVSFQNAPWGSRPELAKINRFEVQVALLPLLSKKIELKRLLLAEPDILIETNASGKSNLEFEREEKETLPKPKEQEREGPGEKLPSLMIRQLEVVKARLTYRDGRSGKATAVTLDRLSASSGGPESPIELRLKGTYQDEPLEVEGTVGPIVGLRRPDKPWPVNLVAKAFGAHLRLEGAIHDVLSGRGLELRFGLKGNDLTSLGKALGKNLPFKGPFDLSGLLTDPAPRTYRLSNLKVVLAGSDLEGSLEVNLTGKRPKISARLSSQKLDIRSLLGEGSEKSPTSASAKPSSPPKSRVEPGKIFPDSPLPLEVLGQVDLNASLQAAQAVLPKMALSGLSVDMSLQGGRLVVKPFKADISGGTLEGNLDLQAQPKSGLLVTDLKITQLDLGRLLAELRTHDAVEGRLDADIRATGRGSSIAELMAGLNGRTVLSMKNGKIKNKYIDLIGGDLSANILRMLSLSPQESQYTPLHCFVCGFNIKEGIADTTALVIDTDQMSVIGEGQINLRNEKLNISFNPLPKGGMGSQTTGKLSLGLSELAKVFRLTGTLAKPSLGIDPTQTALTVGKMAGGFVLLGPAGLAVPLVSKGGQVEGDLCATALEAARQGIKMSRGTKQEKKETPGPAEKAQEGLRDLGKQLKKLFGK